MLKMRKTSDGNRSRFEIIAQILTELRVPTGKTAILSHCNMSFIQLGPYLRFMGSNDLIQPDAVVGKVRYQRTETGRRFLELYDKMALLLDPDTSEFFLAQQ